MKRILRSVGIMLAVLFAAQSHAQTTASYSFSAFTSTYSSISSLSGVTSTTAISGDDWTMTGVNLGFTFNYCGSSYNTVAVCSNGFINLANTTANPWTNVTTSISSAGWLLAYWDDLHGAGHTEYYITTGSAPNRVFIFEWNNFHHFFTTGNANIQMRLYETTGVIEYWFGTGTYGAPTPTSGITNTASDYSTINNLTSAPTATTGTFYTISSAPVFPSANQVYRWSPCPVLVTAANSGPVCPGGTVSLTGTTTGTSWSWTGPAGFSSTSLSPTLTGVTGSMAGTYVLSATNGTCTMTASTVVTVSAVPPAPVISPTVATTMCNGATLALTSSAAATWSGANLYSDAAATTTYSGGTTTTVYIHPTSVTTPTAFTYTATVTNAAGCSTSATKTITVNPAVASITGPTSVCNGYNITLTSTSPGGTWSSSNTAVGTVGSLTGIVTGVGVGTTTIFYTVAGCSAVYTVTVTPTPGPITGIMIACLGSTTTLSNSLSGGTWSSSNPAIGSVGASTGVVTGVSLGTCTITYDMGSGCYSTTTVSVNPYPSAITGSPSVCVGACTPWGSATPGGLWTSSAPGIATVGVTTGNVCGVSLGTATISYRVAGCAVTQVVTVVNAAAPIVGPGSVCVGSTITLSDATSGGSWSSSTTAVGTVGSLTGVVMGMSTGTTIITYALSAGCFDTAIVTVTPAPVAIGGTLSVCEGLTTALTHAVSGGTWSSSTPAVGSVGIVTGVVSGITPGTTTITYTTPGGCFTTSVVTVNANPAAITGTMSMCQGGTTTLSSATPGGTWTSGTTTVATIDAGGVVTGSTTSSGTSTITYTVTATGCITTATVTVNANPAPITGTALVCAGQTTALSDATFGGAWSSSTPAVGTVSGAGVVTGLSGGTTEITYALGTGCYTTRVVTVDPGPNPITGTLGLCVGFTTSLACTTPGGVWSSGNPSVASILSPGLIGGVSAGTAMISYTVGSCSSLATVTVNPLPGTIGGPSSVCVGQTITLTNSASGGVWSSSTAAVGTVDAATGVVTGISTVAPGTTTITYSLGSGCLATKVVSVNANPGAIGPLGSLTLCEGITTTLTSSPAGGTWLSSNTSVATIVSGTGSVSAAGAGTTSISYTLSSGCRATAVLTVNALPAVITGVTSVCVGQSSALSSSPSGGVWSSSNGNASVNPSTGVVTGVVAGTSTISYTVGGCSRTVTMLVNANPTSITPATPQVCEGATQAMTGSPAGGTWSSSTTAVGTIGVGTGLLGGTGAGTTGITYTLASGCYLATTATVNPQPTPLTGVLTVCVGQTTALGSTPTGGTWASSNTAIATVNSSGVVSGVSGGGTSATAIITYTSGSGCRRQATVTVFALPGSISGGLQVCAGATSSLSCTPVGGTWTMPCGLAAIGVTTGSVSAGTTAGTCDVTYTLGTGCIRTAVLTVAPLPTAITGTPTTCVGQTTTLASTPTGGTWSSSNTTQATVDAAGVVTGVSGITTPTITYTAPNTCRITQSVTVYALPGNISGSLGVCEGQTTTLGTTPATPGGTWMSTTTAVGTIDVSTGVLAGITPGTTTITYTLGTGCYKTAVATVNANPLPITGTQQVCVGSTTTLTDFTGGGTWSASPTSVATVGAGTGVVTGVSGTNTATVSYTLSTGCRSTVTVTVYALPTAITGPAALCHNETQVYGSTPGGGSWGGSGAISVNPVTGAVTGVNPGTTAATATITYTQGIGCVQTKNIIVNPLPAAITGNPSVCIGFTTALATTSTGGNWSSTNTAVATVDASGLVSSVSATPSPATTTISYTFTSTGCASTVNVTVHPLPTPIVGPDAFCNLSTAVYSSTPSGGTWSSADTTILTVVPGTGAATGVLPDTTDLIYTSPAGCSVSKSVFLILAPYPIGGPNDVCLTHTVTLTNVIGGGTWTSSNPATIPVVPATPTTATITGLSLGTATISYTLSTGCFSTKDETVNPIPSGTTGPTQVCEASCITLVNTTPGGTWTSSDPSIASIGSASGITCGTSGGTVVLSYVLGSGCNAQFILTVNPLPAPPTGGTQVCEGSTLPLSSTSTGGAWSSANPPVASVGASSGVVTGVSATMPGVGGPGATTITYTLPTGCLRVVDVTVNPLPDTIAGPQNTCVGNVVTLTDATAGGGWISSNPAIGSIDASGNVTGIAPGTTIISYMLPTGCLRTIPFTVYTNPAPISGSLTVCAGFATNLVSAPTPGAWSQDPASMMYGTINAVTGVVSGITAGTIPVTYTLGSGCYISDVVTVINVPAPITGIPTVCVGGQTTMIDTVAGGLWSISNPARGTIDALTGVLTGISAGTATVTYSVGTGCFNVHNITVNALPAVITGPLQVCEGAQITLASATPGGLWISGNTAVATAGYVSGIVTGIAAGTSNISYSLPTGCMRQVEVTVNVTPPAIAGNFHVCMGSTNTLTNTLGGGTWISSDPAVATVNNTTGVVTPVTLGTAYISYVLPVTGCFATHMVTVQPLPVVYNVTGGGNYCAGSTGVMVGLSGSQIGVSYVVYNGPTAAGYVPGTGSAVGFGSLTASGVYTVLATNVNSGCTRVMAGSATVVVDAPITPVVSIAVTPTDTVCPGETVVVSPNPGTTPGTLSYLWKVNGVTVSSANTYSFIPANGDVVTVRMSTTFNCVTSPIATANRTMTVLPTAAPVVTVSSDPNDTVCQYNPVTFTANPLYGGSAPGYAWTVNGAAAGTGPTYYYVPQDGDVVSVSMTSNYRCRTTSTAWSGDITMSVDSIKLPHVTIYTDPGLFVEAGKPVTLHTLVTDAGPSPKFQWKVNGVPVAGATLSSYTAVFHDYDSISCQVVSSGVCANIGTSDWVFVTVTPLSQGQLAGAVGSLQIVPNPNKGVFTIKGQLGNKVNEDVSIEVTNTLGQVVYRGTVAAKQGRVDGRIELDGHLANGMYLLTLRASDEQHVFHFVMEQ